jgi:2-polyprenyl-6-hydroxyphenyl methylase/3-demethylubiquinone-9 3-methyltransferase
MHDTHTTPQFDFGENWTSFARGALSAARIEQSRADFSALLAGIELQGKSFLDIGFGQGLAVLSAAAHGGRVVGCDVNPKCRDALAATAQWFPDVSLDAIEIVEGSILDVATLAALRDAAPSGDGRYDVVHAWGVLHHTGDMWSALTHAAGFVREGGHLVVALYNRHFTSRAWRAIKRLYCVAPPPLRRATVAAFVPVIFAAKLVVTWRNPLRQQRGMDFYYDVVDWVGGYPYEYASIADVCGRTVPLGFTPVCTRVAEVPTGCNELVFQRICGG